jgi:hypothetical protein
MSKAAAMEEMYLIYRVISDYLAGTETWGDFALTELMASYRSFCQREPIGGMFLESVLEELLDRIKAVLETVRRSCCKGLHLQKAIRPFQNALPTW